MVGSYEQKSQFFYYKSSPSLSNTTFDLSKAFIYIKTTLTKLCCQIPWYDFYRVSI